MIERSRATSRIQIDDARVRVTEWRFPPGTSTGWHRHEFDYIVVPMTGGTLRLERSDGTSESTLTAGEPYVRDAGVEHDVINVGDDEMVFVEVEIKTDSS